MIRQIDRDACLFYISLKHAEEVKAENPYETKGKLYNINVPVLGVFGTDANQGKFTLQLELRKRFVEAGYEIEQLGTEPNSLLFGFQHIYPMGFIKGFSFMDMKPLQH